MRYLRRDGFYLGKLKLALKKMQVEQRRSPGIHLRHREHVGRILSTESFTSLYLVFERLHHHILMTILWLFIIA